ncbi:unnamed protein product [Hanseniaspora opuntiae]
METLEHAKSLDESEKESSLRPVEFKTSFHEVMFLIVCALSQILNQGAQTQTLTLFNTISKDLNASPNSESWLMASFSLVSGSVILITGHLGDIYGWKKLIMIGYVLAFIGSLIVGFSHYSKSVNQFIVARAVLQAVGVSCILPNLVGIVGKIYEQGSFRKFVVIAILGAGAPTGAVLGCFMPGVITHFSPESTWPWAFYAYAILCVITSVISFFYLPTASNGNNQKVDWWGMVFGVYGLAGFNFAWNQAGIDGWQKGYNIGILISSVLSLYIFYKVEQNFENPILDPKVIKNFKIVTLMVNVLFGWGSFGVHLFYLYQVYLNVAGDGPLEAGLKFLPFLVCGLIACALVPVLIGRITAVGLTMLSSLAFFVGCLLFSLTPPHISFWKMQFIGVIILSFGMDFSFPSSQIILSDLLPNGNAGSLVSTMTNYGMSLFLGIAVVAQREVGLRHPKNSLLKNIRAGQYFGVGVAVVACVLSVILLIEMHMDKSKDISDDLDTDTPCSETKLDIQE